MNGRDLDNYITGHYGEDQFKYDRPEYLLCLDCRKRNLAEDCSKGECPDCASVDLVDATCDFCAQPSGKQKYCSKGCARADAEGM